MALPSIRIGRALAYVAAIAIAAFILAPIYLITISAFSSFDAVYDYPKNLVPSGLTMESMNIFLDSDGVKASLLRSVYVAALTIFACLAIGTPAGYALARFSFRAANPFQLALVSTRAFPLIIIAIPLAVTYLRVGIDDTIYGVAMAHIAFTLPLTVLVMASVFAGISYELEEAAMTQFFDVTVGIPQPLVGLSASGTSARPSRSCRVGDLRLRDDVERGLRRVAPDVLEPHAARADAGRARYVAASVPPCRGLLPARACAHRDLHHPQVPVDDVGAGRSMSEPVLTDTVPAQKGLHG